MPNGRNGTETEWERLKQRKELTEVREVLAKLGTLLSDAEV